MRNRVFCIELVGALFIIILGTLLHFTYEWLNCWKPAALFAAVNESVWEHLKLAFWPSLLFAVIEYSLLGETACSFIKAKAASLYIMPAAIIILFYTYTGILGHNVLIIDILIFIISVLLGQYASYKIQTTQSPATSNCCLSIAAILLAVAAFSLFTFYPPHLNLFLDPVTGGYGITV